MILVTGATGNNGTEIVKQLAAAGAPVRALVRNPQKAKSLESPGVEIVQGDLAQPESLKSALEGVDRVMLISSFAPDQVELQGNVIEAAKQVGSPHIVKFSVLAADPNAQEVIFRWHGQTEKQLEASGLPWTHLQPNSFMQNMFAFASTISGQGAFYEPLKNSRVSLVDIRDVGSVAVKTLTEPGHKGKAYEITGPEAITFYQVADKLSAAIGKKVAYVDIAPGDFKTSMMGYGLPEWMVDALIELGEAYSRGAGEKVTGVVADVTGKQPITFEQFARDNAAAFGS